MLNINLLTEHRDAEKEYRKMQAGAVVVDHLAMHLDRTVRRRVHQNIRNGKNRSVKREAKIKLQLSRRTGMALVLDRIAGQPNRDVLCKQGPPSTPRKVLPVYMKDLGSIKHNHHHEPDNKLGVEPKFNIVTPEDVNHVERQSSLRLSRSRLSATIKPGAKTPEAVQKIITKSSWEVAAERH